MATTLIHNGCFVGALAAIQDQRVLLSNDTAAEYANPVLIATSIADAIATAAATVSLADADLATPKMELTCAQITGAMLRGKLSNSVVDADYAAVGLSIAACIKQAISGWV